MARRRVLPALLAAVAAVGVMHFLCSAPVLERIGLHKRAPRPEEVTTPLEPGVVRDVCSAFGLDEDYPACAPGAVVYAPDFNRAIRQAFKVGVATRQQVDDKLGAYRRYCEGPVEYNMTRYTVTLVTCRYDLKGDSIYNVFITFTEEGLMDKITFGGPGS